MRLRPVTWTIQLRDENGRWYDAHHWPAFAATWRVYETLAEPARLLRNTTRIHPIVEFEQLDLTQEDSP